MAKNDIDYTLLEIIEGPKRINNITHDRLFNYLLEATENQDRFETFMQALEYNAWWAYFGFSLMCSDMIPLNSMFENEFKENNEVKYQRGSTSEYAVFNMLMSYLERGIFTENKHRLYFIRYMAETLAEDEHTFCVTCLQQKYKKEVFPYFKKMYENGKMSSKVHELFSFALNKKFNEIDNFTKRCLPVKKFNVYTKVGNTIFDGNNFLDKRLCASILEFLRVSTIPNRGNMTFDVPMICELYVEENDTKPFMIVSTKNGFITRNPLEDFNDIKFIELFYEGYENYICVFPNNVVCSFVSKDNGFVGVEEIKCKSIKRVKLPLLILGMGINVLMCKTEEGNELSVFVPNFLVQENFKNGDTIEVAKYSSTYYLRRKIEND